MKNRLLGHGKPTKKPEPPKGRYMRVFLSPEYLAWAKRNSLKPAGVAPAMLHTYALQHPGTQSYTIISSYPGADERIFDKPKEGA